MFAFNNAAATSPVADFDWFRIESAGGGGGGRRPARAATTTSPATRWTSRAGTRSCATTRPRTTVGGGNLTITTELGDIYTGDTNPPPNNFILQSADHAGADWVIETKLSATITDGYAQGGLIAYVRTATTTSSSTRSPTPARRGSTASSCARRSGGAIQNPTAGRPDVPAGTTNIWLRLKKAGTTYSGEYSFDGTTWTAVAATAPNAMESPSFGLFAFGPQAPGVGDVTVVRLLHARRAGPARRVRLHRPRRRLRRDLARHREVERDRAARRRRRSRSRTAT